MAVSESNRDLLDLIERVSTGTTTIDATSLRSKLQKCTYRFLNILKYKGPNAASKHEIESRNPATVAGHIRLDAEDVQEVLLFSSEFQIDEIDALECLLEAHKERGDVSAEAAAGIYFEERRALLMSLHRLLQVQALALPEAPDEVYNLICTYNEQLLSQEADGSSILISRLVHLIQDTSLEPKGDSRITAVVDLQGQQLDRHLLLQREQTLLCECLVYATKIRPRFPAKNITNIIDLLHMLSLRLRGSNAGDLTTLQQANLVLLALVQVLLPQERLNEAEGDKDAEALTTLASNSEIGRKLENDALPEDGYVAVARLAWGLLLADHAPPNYRTKADQGVKQATQAGALRFLHEGILKSAAFEDEPVGQQELYGQAFHQLVVEYIDSDPGRSEFEQLLMRTYTEDEARRSSRLQTGNNAPQPDGLHTLLLVLADVFGVFPDLWLSEELRYPVLGDWLGNIPNTGILLQASNALEAYLEVLRSLAVTEIGARAMFHQLHGDSLSGTLSWTKMLDVMKQYCDRYALHMDSQAMGQDQSSQQRSNELLVPEEDARGLSAYLHLFARIFTEAALQDVESWTAELEALANVRPLWEIFFQLMCHPVPQRLKAALDDALAVLLRRPENVGPMWDRLLRSVVVQPRGLQDSASPLPRADLTYQLNEIEARAEDYSETLAFVRLLNALLRASRGVLPENGRPYLHFAEFVRVDLLGSLGQRSYRVEQQKWELLEACLHNLRLWLEALDPATATSKDVQTIPAISVLFDLLGERQAMRAVLQLVLQGMDQIATDRKDRPAGAAKEAALLAALKLLRAAFQVDQAVLDFLRASHQNVYVESLDVVLRRDRKRIPLLLEYVRYPHHMLVQAEALRIAQFLTARIPNLVDLLIPPVTPGARPSYQQIQAGFAACLQDSLYSPSVHVPVPEGVADVEAEAMSAAEDPRADLLMQLLVHSAGNSSPNLTHLLMGFEVQDGVQGVARSPLEPQRDFSCLTVLIRAVQSDSLPTAKPQLYESILELFYILAAAPDSGPPMLHLLRQIANLAPQLDAVACSALPNEADARAASLHQRVWLLQLMALELHYADAAVPQHRLSISLLLQSLFLPPEDSEEQQRLSRRAEILQLVAYPLAEPNLSMDCSVEARRMQQRLDLDTLLASKQNVQEGGLCTLSSRGHLCYDIPRLSQALRERYEEVEQDSRRYGASSAGPNEGLREACRAALRFAQKHNAYVEEAGGQLAAAIAWQMLVEVAVTRRFDMLGSIVTKLQAEGTGEAASATEIVQELLQDTLEAAKQLVREPGRHLVPMLAQVVRTLLARMQAQVAAQMGLAPLASGLFLPARLHETLQQIMQVLRAGYSEAEIRLPLYGALLSYIHVCRGSSSAGLPPSVLTALLEGVEPGTDIAQAAAEMDDMQSQLDEGNAELLQEGNFLIEVLAADAVGQNSNNLARTLALTLLGALVATDTNSTALRGIYATGLPDRILQDLAETPHQALLQAGNKAQAVVQVIVAEAAVMLDITRASLSLRTSGFQQLHLTSLTILSKLRACQVLDLQPEDPGLESSAQSETLRARLLRIVPPLLRLVTAVLSGLPNSRQAKEAGAAFAEAHHKTLLRILREAASPSIRSWTAGPSELEQATLVVQLLSRLVGMDAHMPLGAAQFKAAVFVLVSRFGVIDPKSLIPAVQRLLERREGGPQNEGTESMNGLAGKVYALRAALAQYVREVVMQPSNAVMLRVVAGHPGSPSGTTPSLLLIADMLKQGSEDLYQTLELRTRLLYQLQTMTGPLLKPNTSDGLENGRTALVPADTAREAVKGPRRAVARQALARAAAASEQEVAALVFMAENAVAVVFYHLWRHSSDIGSAQDLEQLRRVVLPTLDSLDRIVENAGSKHSQGTSLQDLIRRTKDVFPQS